MTTIEDAWAHLGHTQEHADKTREAAHQLSIDDIAQATAYVRRNAHETEIHAANKARKTSKNMRDKVFELLRDFPEGLTDHEIEVKLGTEKTRTNRPRRKELVDRGLVADSGRRRDDHIVWITKEKS